MERISKAINVFQLIPKAKIITVTGTNGKGSTSRLIAKSIAKSYNVSLFTSPHIHCLTERFFINNEFINSKRLLSLFENNLEELKRQNIQLSFFEFLFFTFLGEVCFKKSDFLVLEVGLGGRYDATNSVDPDISILTSLGRDHIEFFGNSYRKILLSLIHI